MIKRFLVIVGVFYAFTVTAQEGNSSPYSFYGLGLKTFRGTVENQAMGGVSVFGDSIHINMQNPAAFGALRLTNFAIGGSNSAKSLESTSGTSSVSSSYLEYLALGFPLSDHMGAGFGIIPSTSVDYDIFAEDDKTFYIYNGSGGMNKVFLSLGYEMAFGLRLGVEADYNFGNIRTETVIDEDDVQYGLRELNRSDMSGLSYKFGAQYEGKINEDMKIYSSFSYKPSVALSMDNTRSIETVIVSRLDKAVSAIVSHDDVTIADDDVDLPSELTVGLGLGKNSKWFAAAEYVATGSNDFPNRTFEIDDAYYADASQFKFGGFYIPRYNSISSYWERVTYRAGVRFENTGLNVREQDINEFGISFGVSLPLGRTFSNANIMFEYGQRGTTDAGLVKEDIFKIGLSLSLNAKWFQPIKFN